MSMTSAQVRELFSNIHNDLEALRAVCSGLETLAQILEPAAEDAAKGGLLGDAHAGIIVLSNIGTLVKTGKALFTDVQGIRFK